MRYDSFPFLDFFAGSGLVAEGLKPGFHAVWANDVCPKKAKVFCSNHPDHIFLLGPIEQVRGDRLPSAVLSWGSFPCQDLSLAGNMGGLSSERSGLVWEWLRVMDEMPEKPPLIVAENVIGLVSSDGGAHFRNLFQALDERGYNAGAVILDASDWIPQSRKRVFLIAADRRIPISDFLVDAPSWCHPSTLVRAVGALDNHMWWRLPRPEPLLKTIDDIFDASVPPDEPEKRDRLLSLIPEEHRKRMEAARNDGKSVFPGYKRIRKGKQVLELRFDGLAGCLRTPGGGSSRQHIVSLRNNRWETRLLSVKETALLMGAPAEYKIPGTYNDGYKAMGDAVAVPVSSYLSKHLLTPLAEQAVTRIGAFRKGA